MLAPEKRVLVVGGSGYVGQFVIQALTARGARVHVTHRPGREPRGLPGGAQLHPMEITDVASVAAVVREVAPDVVVNCAAISAIGAVEKDPEAARAVNCPRELVEEIAAEDVAPRLFVHFSTDIVFDGDPSKVYDEDCAPAPVNAYGRMKAEFDAHLAGRSRPVCVVLRPTNIIGPLHPYGATGGTKFLQWLDGRLQADEATKVFDDEYRNYIWVEDLAEVVVRLVEDFPLRQPPHALMHCGGPEALSRLDVARALAAAKGYADTYREVAGGAELPRVVPTKRADVDLGYASPLCVRFRSERVEAYMGRPMRPIAECIRAHASRI